MKFNIGSTNPRPIVFRGSLTYYLLVLLLVITGRSAHGAYWDTPGDFTATYSLKKSGIEVASVTRRLIKTGENAYLFSSMLRSSGLVELVHNESVHERSRWHFSDTALRPTEFFYERSGGSGSRRVEVIFDWHKGRATNIINGDAWKMAIPPGTVDKLLYQLAIMRDLEKAGPVQSLEYNVADGGKLKTFRFQTLGTETIATKLGQLSAVKLRRQNNKRTIHIWCAVDYHYLPVLIEHQQAEHGTLRLTIDSVTGIPKTAK